MKPPGVLLVFMIFVIQSCKKEHCPVKGRDQVPKVTSIRNYHNDGTFYTLDYEYNTEGQLKRERQIDGNHAVLFETVFHYQNGRLAVEEMGTSPKISEFRYTYTGQLLSGTEYVEYKAGPVKYHFKRAFLHEGSRISKITETNLMNDSLSNYTVISYIGKNISSVKTYDVHTNELKDETQLEYDNKTNPFYAIKENTGNALYASSNNITQIKILVKNGNPVNEITQYEYEYNADNYPVKKSHIFTGGGKLLEQTYIYQ